jgi:N,N'-diacetyllegionaminate synthase
MKFKNKNPKTYIIAEAGVNHNGDLGIAFELINKAKEIGADCVKFQTFKTEEIVTLSAPKANYQLNVTDKEESQFEMLKKLELNKESFILLKNECDRIGIDFMSTPYSLSDLELLDQIGVGYYKIASGQLTELFFLKEIAKKMKPIILSTGMGNLSEVYESVRVIREINPDITVLQCTTNYPSLIEESNIKAMVSIRDACKVAIGYSDHVVDNYACYAAVALGAEMIEKHFTLEKNMEGPDHSCSLNPEEFRNLVHGIRSVEMSLGNGLKEPTVAEEKNIYGMRRGLVANKKINKGEVLTLENIGVKRPMKGLSPARLEDILGKKISKELLKDDSINEDNIVW